MIDPFRGFIAVFGGAIFAFFIFRETDSVTARRLFPPAVTLMLFAYAASMGAQAFDVPLLRGVATLPGVLGFILFIVAAFASLISGLRDND